MRWYAQDEVNQEESEHHEVDGMKKRADPQVRYMHHLTCGISSLHCSVNIILFTVLLVHLILRISPHHSHYLRSHHLSLPRPLTPDPCSRLKTHLFCFTNLFLHRLSMVVGLYLHGSSTSTGLSEHWELAFFVCSFFFWYIFVFLLRVLDLAYHNSTTRIQKQLFSPL